MLAEECVKNEENLFSILNFLFCSFVCADTILPKDYERLKNTESFKVYIDGVGTGYSWALAYLRGTGAKGFYCPPPKLVITQENYLSILAEGMKEKNISNDTRIEFILLLGLIKTFPCK